MGTIFHIGLYQPLFNALVFLYNTIAWNDLGVAVIFLTIIIRALLYPLFYKSFKNQTILQRIQPEIKRIQESHKDNREKQAQALLELYRTHKVNPFSSFFLIFLQLPILIALYRVFLGGFSEKAFVDLYSFVHAPEAIHNMFLGLINLGTPNIIIVVLAALTQYAQGKMSIAKTKPGSGEMTGAEKMARQMTFVAPIITIVILYRLPSVIGIYWLTTSLFSLLQQMLVNRSIEQDLHRGTISITSKENS